jgi:carbon-monoxide dehydrogenase medium subunit
MALRLSRPTVLVDINGLGLDHVVLHDGVTPPTLRIGALTRHVVLETNALVGRVATALGEAAGQIGYPAIRNRGTLGGSLAHADPVAELPAALLALGANVRAEGPGGHREVPVADLWTGFLTTSLAPTELITEVAVPVAGAGTGSAWREHAPRSGDFALCGVAAVVSLAADRTLRRAALAGCGLGPVAADLSAAVSPFVGARRLDPEMLTSLGQGVSALVEPPDDIHASAADRRVLAGQLAAEAVATAWSRAEQSLER